MLLVRTHTPLSWGVLATTCNTAHLIGGTWKAHLEAFGHHHVAGFISNKEEGHQPAVRGGACHFRKAERPPGMCTVPQGCCHSLLGSCTKEQREARTPRH